jgi:1-acyl-sn-glycerol-3-phosphate acyltransferase
MRTFRKVFATLMCYLLGYELTAVGVILGCLAALVNWKAFIRVGCVVWANLQFWILGRHARVRGREHLAPGKAYLVIANHSSLYDIPALMAAVPGIAIMGRDYLTRIPVFGQLLKILHYVPIDTGSARSAREALSRAAREIQDGVSVGIFPEGTRTPTGKVQQLKRGFVAVLRESESDLLPVSISGTYALKRKGSIVMDPHEPIRIGIGTPLAYSALAGMRDEEIMETVRRRLQEMGDKRT